MIAIDYHNSCETPTTFEIHSEAVIPNEEVQVVKIFCQLKRFQPQRKMKRNSMRQTALNSSSNNFFCYICTCQSDQDEEQDKSDSKQLSKSNSKLDVLISRPIQEIYAQMFVQSQILKKVQLLKMDLSLRRTESY